MKYLNILFTLLALTVTSFADNAVRLTTDSMGSEQYPDWSSDGHWIAYSYGTAGDRDIYKIPASGGSPTQVTYGVRNPYYPDWSPDGSRIAFSSTESSYYSHIWIVDVNSHESNQLTTGNSDDHTPTWSQDGNFIVFSSTRVAGYKGFDLWKIPATGGNPIRLTTAGFSAVCPAWFPKIDKIAFHDSGNGGIYTIPPSGGTPTQVTYEFDGYPCWSPAGTKIAFTNYPGGNGDIYTVTEAGGERTRITDDPADDMGPTWSPDASKIAFQSNRSGSWDIWVIDVSGIVNIESASLGKIKAMFR